MALDAAKLGALAGVVARDINDIPDLPDYVVPQPGVYKLLVSKIEQREINQKTALVVEYDIVNTVQLNEPLQEGETGVKAGDKFSEAFWFNDPERIETTLSVLKKKYAGLAPALGTTNLLEMLNKMEGMQIKCVITNRVDKEQRPPKIYAQTREAVAAV